DRYGTPENPLPELVLEEAGLAGDRRARDRAREMAKQGRGDARIEQHGIAPRLRPCRVQPRDSTRSSQTSDLSGRIQILEVTRGVHRIIALHRRALAGDDSRRAAVPRRGISAGKSA